LHAASTAGRQRRRRVWRDDQGVAIAALDEGVDVRDLLVVFALRIGSLEGLDVVFKHVDLRLHVDPANNAPGIIDACVREADAIGACLLVLGRVDFLAAQILLPRLTLRARGRHLQQVPRRLELFRIVEILRRRRIRRRYRERHACDGRRNPLE
jgi:hypothetical protein